AGDFDMYLAKITPNAGTKSFDAVFAKGYGSGSGAISLGKAVTVLKSSGDIAVAGWSNGPINFGNGVLNPALNPSGEQPVFARLDSSGTAKFSKMLASGVTMDDDSEPRAVAFHV